MPAPVSRMNSPFTPLAVTCMRIRPPSETLNGNLVCLGLSVAPKQTEARRSHENARSGTFLLFITLYEIIPPETSFSTVITKSEKEPLTGSFVVEGQILKSFNSATDAYRSAAAYRQTLASPTHAARCLSVH